MARKMRSAKDVALLMVIKTMARDGGVSRKRAIELLAEEPDYFAGDTGISATEARAWAMNLLAKTKRT